LLIAYADDPIFYLVRRPDDIIAGLPFKVIATEVDL
jgi:hypothetical protein